MDKRVRLKPILHGAGIALALLGIVYVAQRIGAHASDVDFSHLSAGTYMAMAGLAAIYGLINFLLGMSWWHLLVGLGAAARRKWALWTFGVAQLAKYVPGNIFHLASRQAMGMAAGIAGWTLAKSLTWELALLAMAGITFAMPALPLYAPLVSPAVALGIFLGIVGGLTLLLRAMAGVHRAYAFLWQMGFLVMMGALFVTLVERVAPRSIENIPWMCVGAAYVVAWLVGLVVPGAPAGLGVREAILLLLLDSSGDKGGLLLTVLLMRLVTIGGDLGLFLVSSLAYSKSKWRPNAS